MTAILKRLGDYTRLTWKMAVYSLLGLVWFANFEVFCGKMLPRLGYLTAHRAIANDPPCITPECDFSVFWTAGVLARAHEFAEIYQPEKFILVGKMLFFPAAQIETFFYPPLMLLPGVVISYLPFELGFFVWTLVGIVISVLLLRWAALPWGVILVAALSPAALWNLELGQLGTAMAGFLVCGLLLVERAPWLGGATLGILVLKPQYGLLLPVALLARCNWRGVAGCAAVVLALFAGATFFLGGQVWPEYLSKGLAAARTILENPAGSVQFGVSVFWSARSLGAGLGLSYDLQWLALALAAGGTWFVWRAKTVGNLERVALTVFLSLLATPYGYTDDMVAWSIMLAALAQARGWRIGLLDVLFWLWPILCPVLVMKTGLLITPLIVLLAVARTWYRAGLPVPHLPRRAAVLPRA